MAGWSAKSAPLGVAVTLAPAAVARRGGYRVPVGAVLKVLTMHEEPFGRTEGLTGQSAAVTEWSGEMVQLWRSTGKPWRWRRAHYRAKARPRGERSSGRVEGTSPERERRRRWLR